MPRTIPVLLITILSAVPAAGLAQAHRLTLTEALQRADQGAYANRIAAGRTETQSGQALAPLQGILPTLRLEGGYVRTTDPLNAFGFTLRQRSVTQAAFDPARLNYPPASGNVAAGLVLELPLLNADAYAGRGAATKARDASEAAQAWTHQATALDVVRAYYGTTLAAEQTSTLEAAYRAAQAHVREAESLERNGMATHSDVLLAEVKAGQIESDLIAARSQAVIARRQLAVLLGAPADSGLEVPDSLPAADRVRQLTVVKDSVAVAGRGDVRAAQLGLEAAGRDVQRAHYLYLPRVNSFGRLDWNDPSTPFGGQNSWTVGLMVSWSPFAGASERAEIVAAGGRRAEAAAMAEAAEARATVELAQATDQLAVALARLDIAERAVRQSEEAHRIMGRKYEGGLASVVELFDAAAAETQSRLQLAAARYDAIVAAGARRVAGGLDLSVLSNLES
jgi:outer membrane protein TolC